MVQAIELVDIVVCPFVCTVEVVEGEECAGIKIRYVMLL